MFDLAQGGDGVEVSSRCEPPILRQIASITERGTTMANRDMALQHLQAAAAALLGDDAVTQAQAVQRHAELADEKPGLWTHIEQVTGGFVVTVSYDPLQTPLGLHVPEGSGRRFACADLTEVVDLLHGRFGD